MPKYWNVNLLQPMPESSEIYADDPCEDLLASIRELGVVTPLIVTEMPGGGAEIVSGHRRWRAAQDAGCKSVPVQVEEYESRADQIEAMIHLNRAREKTNAQRAREAAKLMEIERQKAKQRQTENLKKGDVSPVVEKFSTTGETNENIDETKGKSRDAVGAEIGTSGKTAEAMIAVKDEIDHRREMGDSDGAQRLEAALNKSVNAAVRMMDRDEEAARQALSEDVAERDEPPTPEEHPLEAKIRAHRGKLAQLNVLISQAQALVKEIAHLPDTGQLAIKLVSGGRHPLIERAIKELRSRSPKEICPACGASGVKCSLCWDEQGKQSLGWVTSDGLRRWRSEQ